MQVDVERDIPRLRFRFYVTIPEDELEALDDALYHEAKRLSTTGRDLSPAEMLRVIEIAREHLMNVLGIYPSNPYAPTASDHLPCIVGPIFAARGSGIAGSSPDYTTVIVREKLDKRPWWRRLFR
jgi:hypothetical protein